MSKVTFKKSFEARIKEHEIRSSNAFLSCRNEAKIWWDGYRCAINQIKHEMLMTEITESEQEKRDYKKSHCSDCSVPNDLHGTICGWNNAKMPICPNTKIIIDSRHIGFGKNFQDWQNDMNPGKCYSCGDSTTSQDNLCYDCKRC